MSADPKSVLSHGLVQEPTSGAPLLDPSDVRAEVDRGDGVLGTLVPLPSIPALDDLPPLDQQFKEGIDQIYEALGKPIVINIAVAGEHDQATGRRPKTITPVGAMALISRYGSTEIATSDGLIIEGDIKIIVRVSDSLTDFKKDYTITYAGQVYSAFRIEPKPLPGGTVYEFMVQGRR